MQYYADAAKEQISSFQNNGFLIVENIVNPLDLIIAEKRIKHIANNPNDFSALDWAWDSGSLEEREFHIVQVGLTPIWPDAEDTLWRKWATRFSGQLMGFDVDFWYDQILAKPPGHGAQTPWHQDEAYWGKSFEGKGITCWMPFHLVNENNGCMNFIKGGHKNGVLKHMRPLKSDLLSCDDHLNKKNAVICPIDIGSVTFHHGATPHMTPNNNSKNWRIALAQHFAAKDTSWDEELDYEWRKETPKEIISQTSG